MTWPGLDLEVGCCPCPEVSAVKPQLRTQGAPGSLGETEVRTHSRVSQSVSVYLGGVGGVGNPPGRALVGSCEGWVLSAH